jgi:hypothetical protein
MPGLGRRGDQELDDVLKRLHASVRLSVSWVLWTEYALIGCFAWTLLALFLRRWLLM